ncbi:MAG TPA: hypothetical protein VIH54_06660, partial [Chthoniobacterales bacterium]
ASTRTRGEENSGMREASQQGRSAAADFQRQYLKMQNRLKKKNRRRRAWQEKQFACEERRKPVLHLRHWPEEP